MFGGTGNNVSARKPVIRSYHFLLLGQSHALSLSSYIRLEVTEFFINRLQSCLFILVFPLYSYAFISQNEQNTSKNQLKFLKLSTLVTVTKQICCLSFPYSTHLNSRKVFVPKPTQNPSRISLFARWKYKPLNTTAHSLQHCSHTYSSKSTSLSCVGHTWSHKDEGLESPPVQSRIFWISPGNMSLKSYISLFFPLTQSHRNNFPSTSVQCAITHYLALCVWFANLVSFSKVRTFSSYPLHSLTSGAMLAPIWH